MDKTIISQLEALGLSESEARVYLALLAFTEVSVQAVAKAAEVGRSAAYPILESLLDKGLVERLERDTASYRACDPEKLLEYADAAVVKAAETDTSMRALTGELEPGIAGFEFTPRATYFDTAEGLKTLRNEVERAAKSALVRALMHSKQFPNTLMRSGSRVIVAAERPFKISGAGDSASLRLVPKEHHPFTSDLFIIGDTIAVISDTETFAIRIGSKDFADVVKESFDLAWEEAGRLDAKLRKTGNGGAKK